MALTKSGRSSQHNIIRRNFGRLRRRQVEVRLSNSLFAPLYSYRVFLEYCQSISGRPGVPHSIAELSSQQRPFTFLPGHNRRYITGSLERIGLQKRQPRTTFTANHGFSQLFRQGYEKAEALKIYSRSCQRGQNVDRGSFGRATSTR